MIAIIDVGSGNIKSVQKALNFLGKESYFTDSPEKIRKAERIILPGVGNFGALMNNLRERGLEPVIKEVIDKNIPFLGICVGLQILFEESEESPGIKGLGILKGKVLKFTQGKIPQIGWNEIESDNNPLFPKGYVYFVNSFYVQPEEKSVIAASSDYYQKFTAAIQKENLVAVQFHPEKSGDFGINIIKRWLKC